MRLDVKKTYKLFIAGKFPRSESGRSYQVKDSKANHVANVALASRKDVRDAVQAARAAQPGWAGASAYNRGQVLYRIAEMLEGRREQFVSEISSLTGKTQKQADAEVSAAIDSWVWHAGWTDKIDSVAGSMNPVVGTLLQHFDQPANWRGRSICSSGLGLGGFCEHHRPSDCLGEHRGGCHQRAPISTGTNPR